MSARDPDTGRFVSRESADGMDDLETQHRMIRTERDTPGTQGAEEVQIAQEDVEPAGGLERGELAELVAVVIWQHRIYVEGVNTTPGQIKADFAVTDSADPDTFYNGRGKEAASNLTDVPYTAGVWENESERVLLRLHGVAEQAYDEDVLTDVTDPTGSAGDAENMMAPTVINYRGLAGTGYVMDRHDELYEHQALEWIDLTNADASVDIAYTMIWDVRDDP